MLTLWRRMDEMFPVVWGSQMGAAGDDNGIYKTWFKVLGDLNSRQVKRGIDRLANSGAKFIPAVSEFKAMCRGSAEDLGLPVLYEAYGEAAKFSGRAREHVWSHPVVYAAAKEVGFYDLQRKPKNEMIKLFKPVYERCMQQVADGVDFGAMLPEPDEVEAPVVPVSAEVAKSHIEKIRELQGR